MGSEYDPWAMLHNTDMNENLEEVTETDDCKVLRMSNSGGDGLMTADAGKGLECFFTDLTNTLTAPGDQRDI